MKKYITFALGIFLSLAGFAQQKKYNIPTLDSVVEIKYVSDTPEYRIDVFEYDSLFRNTSWRYDFISKGELTKSTLTKYGQNENGMKSYETIDYLVGQNPPSPVYWFREPDSIAYFYNDDKLVTGIAKYVDDFSLYINYTSFSYTEFNQVSITTSARPFAMWWDKNNYFYNNETKLLDSVESRSIGADVNILIYTTKFKYENKNLIEHSTLFPSSPEKNATYYINYKNNIPVTKHTISYTAEYIDSLHYESSNEIIIPYNYSGGSLNPFSSCKLKTVDSYVRSVNDWIKISDKTYFYSDDKPIINDTIFITETINVTDTVYITDTVIITDTISIVDSVIISDTVYISGIKQKNEKFVVYPNPTHGKFTIGLPQKELFDVRIYDFEGKLVFIEERTYKNEFDISQLNKGVYLVQIHTGKKFIGLLKIIKK